MIWDKVDYLTAGLPVTLDDVLPAVSSTLSAYPVYRSDHEAMKSLYSECLLPYLSVLVINLIS